MERPDASAKIERVPVKVTLGMTALPGDCPAMATDIAIRGPLVCAWVTKEQEAQFGDANEAHWWAEFNGASFDLIEPMTDAEVLGLASDVECPF